MVRGSLAARVVRIQRAMGDFCPACAARPALPGVMFRWEGRLTDGRGHDLDESALVPCNVCGTHPLGGLSGAIKILGGLDPKTI